MKDILFLFFYAVFKAFLPLPSLEIVLLPFTLLHPNNAFYYAVVGAIGTSIGGSVGYFLATQIKEEVWIKLAGKKTWDKGKELVNKYGVYAVFIGGITPIPDFLLAYLAGITRMSFLSFVLSDGIARFIRSVLILYTFLQIGMILNIDKYGMYFLYAFIAYFLLKYLVDRIKSKKE